MFTLMCQFLQWPVMIMQGTKCMNAKICFTIDSDSELVALRI